MLLDAGNLNLRQLMAGDPAGKAITQIVVGTSNTPVQATDTTITNAVVKTIISHAYLPGGIELFIGQMAATDPAMVIREMGLLNAAGVLCHRKVIADYNYGGGVVVNLNYETTVY